MSSLCKSLVAASFMAASLAAAASPVTSVGSGLLGTSGFGYFYSVTVDASAGSFTFNPTGSYNQLQGLIMLGGSFVSNAPVLDVENFDFSASVTMSFINLATGQAAPSPYKYFSGTASGMGFSTNVGSGAIRFSNSTLSKSSSLVAVDGSFPNYGQMSLGQPSTIRYTEEVHFAAGHYAVPSSDPSCASVQCMPVMHDTLGSSNYSAGAFLPGGIGSFIYITAVPEPETFALMFAGLAMVGFMARNGRRAS